VESAASGGDDMQINVVATRAPPDDSEEMLTRSILPIPDRFVERLQDYCEQAKGAIKRNKHHDQRRALFMDFLRKAFDVQVDEVELEHKVTYRLSFASGTPFWRRSMAPLPKTKTCSLDTLT
jgi:hypothetical protein